MLRTIVLAAMLFATAVALGGAEHAPTAGVAITEGVSAAPPDFCETFQKVRNTVIGEPDDSCPHGPTP